MKENEDKEQNPFDELLFGDWIPRQRVKDYFGYGQTTMSTFAKDNNIRVSKIGKRIFYYKKDILNLLERNTE